MKGRIGGKEGYDILCTVEEEKIIGRAGGKLYGKNLEIIISDTGVDGKVGNEEISVHLDSGELRGTIGKQEIVLRGVDQVRGFLGKPIVGWNIVAQQQNDTLIGHLDGTVLNKQFELSLGGAPGWIGTLVAIVAFYALEPRAQVASV